MFWESWVDGNGAEECPVDHFGVCLVHVRQIGFVDFIVTKINFVKKGAKSEGFNATFISSERCGFCLHLTQLYCRH